MTCARPCSYTDARVSLNRASIPQFMKATPTLLTLLVCAATAFAQLEPGLTFRIYDIQESMDQIYPLVPGQTPNVDEKRSTIDYSGSAQFGNFTQYYLVECLAEIEITVAGTHGFRLTSDDGSELLIDDVLVLDHDGIHGATSKTGTANLTAGLHSLRVNYFQNIAGATLHLEWLPPGATSYVTVPATAYKTTAGVTRVVAPGKKNIIRPGDGTRPGSGQPLNAVHPSWTVTKIHPASFNPKVGAMDFHPDGRLFITTFNPNQTSTPNPLPGGDGKVWALSNVGGNNPEAVTVTEVAAGLSEPLGLKFIGGLLHVSERLALTRLRDTDGNGYYETHETVSSGWISDNYHHFHFGLIEKNGFAYTTLSTAINFSYSGLNGPNPPNRGTLVRTNLATGAVSYLAGGLRTPNGLCFGPDDQIFQTDNQGAWQPASRLNHLRQGRFYGHYNTTSGGGSPSLFANQPETRPAVFFPQNEAANSPSQPVMIPSGSFAGDLLVGEVTLGGINRVSLEKINGTWQGAVYRFSQGFEAGINRLVWGPDGSLYVGCIGGTGNWSWNGTQTGLQRLSPKPGSPVTFEIKSMKATRTGFEITYSKPVPAAYLGTPANFTVKQWYYAPSSDYGGNKIGEQTLTVASSTPSADRTKVTLVVNGLQPSRVVYLKTDPISDTGEAIWSSEVWYTLNETPGMPYNVALQQQTIQENQPAGTLISTITANHDTPSEVITFSLPAQLADNAKFQVSGNQLLSAIPFDYERRSAYQVTVRATDSQGASRDATFTIQVIDQVVEHPAHRIVLSDAVLPPDHPAGALVGALLVHDRDLGDGQAIFSNSQGNGPAPIVYEPFDYATGNLPGKAGGSGFSAGWVLTTGNTGTVQANSLSYLDSQGRSLVTLGNKSASGNAGSRNSRGLSATRGADNTVTYVSFIADVASNVHFWGVEFWNGSVADANRVLQLGNESGFGVRARNGTNKFFASANSESHFYVLKINHLPGNDTVSVWIDPPLDAEPSTANLSFTTAEVGGSLAFQNVGFSSFVATSGLTMDEFRLGSTWSSVTPWIVAFPQFALVPGEGATNNASFTLAGNWLSSSVVLPAGLYSIRVRVTDSANLSYEQPLQIFVGSGHLDADGDGVSNALETVSLLNPFAPGDAALDGDGDGFSNAREAMAGSDPRDAASSPGLDLEIENGEIKLTWLTFRGFQNWLEASPICKAGPSSPARSRGRAARHWLAGSIRPGFRNTSGASPMGFRIFRRSTCSQTVSPAGPSWAGAPAGVMIRRPGSCGRMGRSPQNGRTGESATRISISASNTASRPMGTRGFSCAPRRAGVPGSPAAKSNSPANPGCRSTRPARSTTGFPRSRRPMHARESGIAWKSSWSAIA